MAIVNRSLAALSAAVCAAALSAEVRADESTFEMSTYIDDPGGQALLAGNYSAAIAAASRGARGGDTIESLVAHTNLCVAYTVTAQFSAADSACEKALRLASRADHKRYIAFRGETATAKALSNRGVLRALSGDVAGAASDFRRAEDVSGESSAARRNLAHLEASPDYRLSMALAADDGE